MNTNKAVYHTKTQEEYDWLMAQLENEGCRWSYRVSLKSFDVFRDNNSQVYIRVTKNNMGYSYLNFYENDEEYRDYEFIEVSDLMQPYKDTKGKPKLSLVPPQILFDIAEVRECGIEHYKHMACNMAFICEMEEENGN